MGALVLIRPMLALSLCALAAAVAPPLRAESGSEVRSWLMRIHEAAKHRNFQGTFVVSSGGTVASARISHFCDGRNQFERIESLDGPARQVFRHNDLVHTLWPGTRTALLEHREQLSAFPALLQAGNDRIQDVYEVQPQASDRIAGREADVLLVRPRDAHRFGFRLWADKASGLLLRSDVLGERQEVLETAAFSDVIIDVRPLFDSVLQPMRRLDGYRVVRMVLTPSSLEGEGWALRHGLPGFRQVSCVRRPIDGLTLPSSETANAEVLQTIYSDGLTYVSVFIERFDAARHSKPMLTSTGATQTLMQRRGDWWITAVGDVPAATLRAFANGLERKK